MQIVDSFDTNDLMLAHEQHDHDGSYFAHVVAIALRDLLDGDESTTELDAETIEERLKGAEVRDNDVDGKKTEEESRRCPGIETVSPRTRIRSPTRRTRTNERCSGVVLESTRNTTIPAPTTEWVPRSKIENTT